MIQSKIAVGVRRDSGGGASPRNADPRTLPAGAAQGFHLLGLCRRARFRGRDRSLGLYFLLLMQIVQNAQTSPDRAGMYICMGVAALLLFHVLVNVGMVVGRMPVTGIPLPLMSSGGSEYHVRFFDAGAGQQCTAPAFYRLTDGAASAAETKHGRGGRFEERNAGLGGVHASKELSREPLWAEPGCNKRQRRGSVLRGLPKRSRR